MRDTKALHILKGMHSMAKNISTGDLIWFLINTNDSMVISLGSLISGFQTSLSTHTLSWKRNSCLNSHLYSHFQLLNDGGLCYKQTNSFSKYFSYKAEKPLAQAKKDNDTAVLLLQCFVFCIVMYYLFAGYFCWISGLISYLIHLTCEYMTSLFVSVTDHLGSR